MGGGSSTVQTTSELQQQVVNFCTNMSEEIVNKYKIKVETSQTATNEGRLTFVKTKAYRLSIE